MLPVPFLIELLNTMWLIIFFISGQEENDEKRLENLVYIELIRRYGKENIFLDKIRMDMKLIL